MDTKVYLRITPIRYSCEHCDDHPTITEPYNWCDRNASTTKSLDDYIMRCLINSTIEDVSKKEKIGQRVVQGALDRQVKEEVNWDKMSSLETIQIDEISLKKGHNSFVTVVSAKSKEEALLSLLLLKEGKKKLLKDFCNQFPMN